MSNTNKFWFWSGVIGATAIAIPIVFSIVDDILIRTGVVEDEPDPDPLDKETKNEKKRVREQLRGKVIRRAKFRCEGCGEKRTTGFEVFYIISPYEGGECTYNNLRALCPSCRTGTKLE